MFYPTPTPDASQWNIGGVGPSGIGAGVGYVHFMLFMSISFAPIETRFSVEYGLNGLNIDIIEAIYLQCDVG